MHDITNQNHAEEQQAQLRGYTHDTKRTHSSNGSSNGIDKGDADTSSTLSVPNENIDFRLVYAIRDFNAKIKGQINVAKGDGLVLMDDSNNHWWLVRVLETTEIGYIPAESAETAFERLGRLNKHRNGDLASATQAEVLGLDARHRKPPSKLHSKPAAGCPVGFRAVIDVHCYPPEEVELEVEDNEWLGDGYAYQYHDPGLVDMYKQRKTWEEKDVGDIQVDSKEIRWDNIEVDSQNIPESLLVAPLQSKLDSRDSKMDIPESLLVAPLQSKFDSRDSKMDIPESLLVAPLQSKLKQTRAAHPTPASKNPPAERGTKPVPPRLLDLAVSSETRKLKITPNIIQEKELPQLPGATVWDQIIDTAARPLEKKIWGKKRAPTPDSPASPQSQDSRLQSKSEEREKMSVFSKIFGWKKKKSGDMVSRESASFIDQALEELFRERPQQQDAQFRHLIDLEGRPGDGGKQSMLVVDDKSRRHTMGTEYL